MTASAVAAGPTGGRQTPPAPLFAPSVEAPPPAPSGPDLWARALEQARANRRLAALLDESRLEGVEGDLVILSMERGWAAMARERAGALEALFSAAAGRALRVEVRERGAALPVESTPVEAPSREPEDPSQHPLVREAIEKLRARVVSVQPRRPTRPDEAG